MTTHSSSATIQPRWLIIVGGTTFLITALMPFLVGEAFSNLLAGFTINSVLSSVGLPETMYILLGACLVSPILLSVFAVSLWKRMLKANKLLTARRGLLTFLQADLLAGIVGFLLATICALLPSIFLNSEGLGFLWLALCVVVIYQMFYSLPFLLIAGALIAQWQARHSFQA